MKTIKRLLQYIKPFKKNLIAAVISAFIGILFSLLVPVFIGYGVDAMVGVDNVDFKKLVQICPCRDYLDFGAVPMDYDLSLEQAVLLHGRANAQRRDGKAHARSAFLH